MALHAVLIGNTGRQSGSNAVLARQVKAALPSGYWMSFRCLIGVHRPLLNSIVRRERGFTAICEGCPTPLERGDHGQWAASRPLTALTEKRAI